MDHVSHCTQKAGRDQVTSVIHATWWNAPLVASVRKAVVACVFPYSHARRVIIISIMSKTPLWMHHWLWVTVSSMVVHLLELFVHARRVPQKRKWS